MTQHLIHHRACRRLKKACWILIEVAAHQVDEALQLPFRRHLCPFSETGSSEYFFEAAGRLTSSVWVDLPRPSPPAAAAKT
jgi:hypothetical protein